MRRKLSEFVEHEQLIWTWTHLNELEEKKKRKRRGRKKKEKMEEGDLLFDTTWTTSSSPSSLCLLSLVFLSFFFFYYFPFLSFYLSLFSCCGFSLHHSNIACSAFEGNQWFHHLPSSYNFSTLWYFGTF